MNILYAIQGTGNGHLSRARDIIPLLRQKGNVDILVSGEQADVDLPYPVRYRYKGLCFVFGKKGGIDIPATWKKANIKRLFKEINELPVSKYDVVISDFEPVSAWACRRKNKACIGLSHQSAVLSKQAPQPKKTDPLGRAVLKHYAPTDAQFGFHFKSYENYISTPVIRGEIRSLTPADKGHYTVYLPAYSDKKIVKALGRFKDVQWQVFSKHNKEAFEEGNVSVRPISNESFIESMASAHGVLCGAGFETPAEALYLGKKLMVIPMKGQYEQQCNAAALADMGVPVIKSLKKKHREVIGQWLQSDARVSVDYPDITATIIDKLFEKAATLERPLLPGSNIPDYKKLQEALLRKIIIHLVR